MASGDASSRRDTLPAHSTLVLLVESHDDTREMYADYLRRYGFAVTTAGTTDDGLRRARDADVIVTEIRVHGSFDGLELVGRLRSGGETKQTPIIVLTACAFDADQKRARAAGCNAFLPKPCLPERLISAIFEVEAVVEWTSSWKNHIGDEPTKARGFHPPWR
jgi:two-component system cell cycle response regulator DivK